MNVDIWLCAAGIVWLPGAAIVRLVRAPAISDRATRIAVQLGAGLAFWPILFLWTSITPLQWSSIAVRCVVGIAAAVAFFPFGRPRFVRHVTIHEWLLAAVVAVTGWTRMRAVAGLALPPWVDSVHHTMLVRLFLMRGTVPQTYDPFIPGATAFYHWGFHSIAAVLVWFVGRTDPFSVARIILSFGQFLNGLAPLFVYSAARSLLRSRTAAVVAAALAGLVSFYPAYYVSWGRFTHLAGVLLFLAWIALAGAAFRQSEGGLRGHRPRFVLMRSAILMAIVAAGLALVHVRLAFFAVTFTVVLIGATLMRRRRPVAILIAGALACLIVLPWFVAMRHVAPTALAPSDADPRWTSPADVRANLLWVPHAAELLSLATAGLTGIANIGPLSVIARVVSGVWWLAILAVATKRRRTRPLLFVFSILATWCAVTLVLVNTTHLQFATNTSAAITAFVPVCLAAGALIAWVFARVQRVALPVIVIVCCVIGVMTLSDVINPATIIANDADVAALRWLSTSTPASSAIAGRVQPWYGGAFIGVDGAYWSSVLADRRSLPPPSLYGWSGSYGGMELFLARWRDEYPFMTRATLAEAKRLGMTHVYFGRGVPAEAPAKTGNVVYARDGITIVAIK